jgi:hypothetical protein
MNLNSTVSNILTNKMVLNVVSVIALLNVIGYMVIGDLNTVLFFIVLVILVKYFSKNMIIVLGIPLIVVNIFAMNQSSYSIEGMENKVDDKKMDDDKNDDDKNDPSESDQTDELGDDIIASNVKDKEQSGLEVGSKKSANSKIDHAATIEDAYDDLNKILGSDGIKNLTDDTQRLMKQQMELAKSMKEMAPIIEKMIPMTKEVKKMMNNMDSQEHEMSGLLDMAKKMSN